VGDDDILTACIPDQPAEIWLEVRLTLSDAGRVTSVLVPTGLTPAVAACILRRATAMEFVVLDPCHAGETEITLSFGRGGVAGIRERHNNALQRTSGGLFLSEARASRARLNLVAARR